jgi:hypothetical protein
MTEGWRDEVEQDRVGRSVPILLVIINGASRVNEGEVDNASADRVQREEASGASAQ